MVDRQFTEPALAGLYDTICAERDDFDFYLPLVMSARSVLDVGCGTGVLLHLARQAGHTGRLCGLDPAPAMLDVARRRPDVEWVLGDLAEPRWDSEFDLVVMTGHAFQVLLDDAELRIALDTVRAALTGDGRFVFETRNPLVRAWETWSPDDVVEITDATGEVVRRWHEAQPPMGDRVTFSTTYESPKWTERKVSWSTLRFLGAAELAAFLTGAGLVIEEQFGDWDRVPLTGTNPEIITIAGKA